MKLKQIIVSAAIAIAPVIVSVQPASTAPQRLDGSAIAEQLRQLPDWKIDGQQISCTYQFANFVEAIAFVNRLVQPSETLGHHPEITVNYNRVTMRLTTHDAGGLTLLDFQLANQIRSLSVPQTCLP